MCSWNPSRMHKIQHHFTIYILSLFATSWFPIAHGAAYFHHRQYHRSIIVGNYLYIDGGEIATWNRSGNGVQDGFGVQQGSCYNDTCLGNITVFPDTNTYSIDLSQSWTNATVVLNAIEKPGSSTFNQHELWLNASGDCFYAYGGGVTWAYFPRPTPPSNTLWKFTPDGSSGTWSQVSFDTVSVFSSLQRTLGGAFASGNGLGFVLGGRTSGQTSSKASVDGYPPGLVIFNSSSQQWSNVSTTNYSLGGSSYGNGAQFVPSFRPNGLLFILGGGIYSSGSAQEIQVGLNTIHMYEPSSQQWKSQTTTGTPPPTMDSSCVVGAQGDNNTYEIFLYGGSSNGGIDQTMQLGNVYVLSIPSFTWHSTNYTPQYSRQNHACSNFNRYMIVTGGQVTTAADYAANMGKTFISVLDPWDQGIGVFDLVDMTWVDRYNASAGPYTTSQSIKNSLATQSRYPASLQADSTLSSWFVRNQNPTTSSNNTNTAPNEPPKSSKSNTGAIAGGVVGGLAALVIIGIAIWWFCSRRRSDRHQPHVTELNSHQKTELAHYPDRGRYELGPHTGAERVELAENKPLQQRQDVYEI